MNLPMKEAAMTMEMFGASPTLLDSTPTTRKHHGRRALTLGIAASAALALFLAGMAGTASAAPNPPSGTTVVTADVGDSIAMSGLVTNAVAFGGIPSETVATADLVSYNVVTNHLGGYNVTASTVATDLVKATDVIPIDALKVSDGNGIAAGAGVYSSMSAAGVIVHTQTGVSGALGDNLTTDFQMLVPNVPAGSYTVTLTYMAAVIGA